MRNPLEIDFSFATPWYVSDVYSFLFFSFSVIMTLSRSRRIDFSLCAKELWPYQLEGTYISLVSSQLPNAVASYSLASFFNRYHEYRLFFRQLRAVKCDLSDMMSEINSDCSRVHNFFYGSYAYTPDGMESIFVLFIST